MAADAPLQVLRAALHASGVVPGQHLVLAWSGGLDSTALLHALLQAQRDLPFSLSLVHVHHGLQPAADGWLTHCQQHASHLGLDLVCARVTVPRDPPEGLEAAARQARLAVLAAQPGDRIVLAQHADDQAETVLLALLRGAGPAGLAAMGEGAVPPSHPLHGRLWRPWLTLPRSVLLAWARAQGLTWIEDPSNADQRHDRNYLRAVIGPGLQGRFPGWRQSLARSAAWAAEAQHLLTALAEADLAHFGQGVAEPAAPAPAPAAPAACPGTGASGQDPARLPGSVCEWQALARPRQRNLLRWLLQQRGLPMMPGTRMDAWLDQLEAAGDRLPAATWADLVLRRWAGSLWLERAWSGPQPGTIVPTALFGQAATMPEIRIGLQLAGGTLRWRLIAADSPPLAAGLPRAAVDMPPVAVGLSRVAADSPRVAASGVPASWQLLTPGGPALPLLAHPLQQGIGEVALHWDIGQAQVQIHPDGPHRQLRKLFQEQGIPPWRRAWLPRVYCGRDLVAVAGVATAPDWRAPPGSAGWQLEWVPAAS